MEQGERIMIYVVIILSTFTIGSFTMAAVEIVREKAYWQGRRAGYARAIADTRNHVTQ